MTTNATNQARARESMQTRDERITRANTDPVLAGIVHEIRAAGLKPAERARVLDLVFQLRDKTRDGHGVTAARMAIDNADRAPSPAVARVLRKIAPRLVTGETTR